VLSSNLAQCQPGFQSGRGPPDPCGDYGTYDNTSSSTAYYVGTGYYDNLIDAAYGNFIGDVVRTGGQTFNNFTFGQITREAYGEYFSEKYEGIFGTCENIPLQITQLISIPTRTQREMLYQWYLRSSLSPATLRPGRHFFKGIQHLSRISRCRLHRKSSYWRRRSSQISESTCGSGHSRPRQSWLSLCNKLYRNVHNFRW